MPRIQPYEQRIGPQGRLNTQATGADFGAGMLTGLGQATEQVAVYLQQKQDDDELSDAQLRIAEARATWTQTYMDRAQTAQPGDRAFASTIREDMGKFFEKLSEGYNSKRAKQYVNLQGTDLAGSFFVNGLKLESDLAGAKAKQDFQGMRDAYGRVVSADPTQYESVAGEISDMLDAGAGQYGALPVTTRNELKMQTREYLAWSAAAQLAEENAEGFLRSVAPEVLKAPSAAVDSGAEGDVLVTESRKTSMPFFNDLPAEKQLQLIDRAKAQFAQDMAIERAEVNALRQDQAVEARSTGGVTAPISQAQFARAYGDRWEAEYAAYTRDVHVGGLVYTSRNLPTDQQKALIEKYEPAPGSQGYKDAKLLQLELYRSISESNTARAKDPIGFALETEFLKADEIAPGTAISDNAALMASRVEQAKVIAETYGTKLAVLSNAEAQGQQDALRVMPPAQQTAYFGQIRANIKDQAAFNAVVRQVVPDSAAVRIAGQLVGVDAAYTKTYAFSNAEIYRPMDVAQRIFEGRFALDRAPGANKEDGAGAIKATTIPKNKDMATVFNEYVGTAFGARNQDKDDVYEAAVAHYIGQSLRDGKDIGAEFVESDFKKSVELVLGGKPVELGGKKTLMPWGMGEAEFTSRLESRFNDIKNFAQREDNRTIQGDYDDYAWVPIADGRYMAVSGTMPVDLVIDVMLPGAREASGRISR